ncbi:MAG: ribbon-helix-helix domain-containing protein, partial [Candidatus Xenobia bacterium]
KTTIYLSEEMKSQLRQMARETGRSEADLIREGIRLALEQHTTPPPRAGIFSSGKGDLSERVAELLKGFGQG